MKRFIYLLIILILCQGVSFAEIKRELVLAVDRAGIEVVISKIGEKEKKDFAEYVIKIEANKALSDLTKTNAFILEDPNRFVIDIPGSNSFKEESIFLADNYMALLRFGTHADKKRLVIDIESSNIFNLVKNINSKNSISYKLALSTGSAIPSKSELAKGVERDLSPNIAIDIPSAKELESYLSPQSDRYLKKILANKNKVIEVKEEISNDYALEQVEKTVVNELKQIERQKSSSFTAYYLLITCIIGLILFHKTRTRRQKRNYFRSLKELRAYSFNTIIKNQKREAHFKNVKINSLGQVGTNLNREGYKTEMPDEKSSNKNDNIYLS